jgi:hypothetical protein
MTIGEVRDRLRETAVRQPLVAALAASLVLHACLYTTWRVGKELGWWKHQPSLRLLSSIFQKRLSAAQLAKAAEKKVAQEQQPVIPLQFVDVDPAAPPEEPPKDTKFYGERSARAANPDDAVDSNVPKLDGKQERMVRLEDSERPKAFPLQPSEPPETAQQPKPKSDLLGDLAKLNPDYLRPPSDGKADATLGDAANKRQERPRRLAQVVEQQSPRAGEKMRQDGGVRRRGRGLDVAGTTFGSYDAAFIRAVEQRWFHLLDNTPLSFRSGKVVLQFMLTYDGRILDMRVADNDTSDSQSFLCQRAVLDPAPYGRWPDDMRRAMGNTRSIQFTFYFD